MFTHAEDVDGPFVAVPIAADALNDARAVVEGVRHNAYLGFTYRYELSTEKYLQAVPIDGSLTSCSLQSSHVLPPY